MVVAPITMQAAAAVVALFIPLPTLCLRVPASAIQWARVVMLGLPVAIPEQTGRTLYLAHLPLLAAAAVQVLIITETVVGPAGPAVAVLAVAVGALAAAAAAQTGRVTAVAPDIISLVKLAAGVVAVRAP